VAEQAPDHHYDSVPLKWQNKHQIITMIVYPLSGLPSKEFWAVQPVYCGSCVV
jgi:hypothetical protein